MKHQIIHSENRTNINTPDMSEKYEQRGVSASKDDVHNAIRSVDKGLFPNAFCKVTPDILSGDKEFCNIVHADGAGTKSSLAYLYWKETGNTDVWKGIARDAIVMNTDDLLCAGVTDNILISSTIGRNKNKIPGEVLKALIEGTESFLQMLREHHINIHSAGGETADLGDLIRTIVVDSTASARVKRNEIIENKIEPGQVILGLSSYGQATYEKEYNSGIGSNGLTSARHDIFAHIYKDLYPESYDPDLNEAHVYQGKYQLTDHLQNIDIDMGRLVLSPTRTYMPVIKQIFKQYKSDIKGMIHCSGGGQTKVLNFIEKGHIVKDNMLPLPPLFPAIQEASGTSWKEMYKVFNMGHRLEIYTDEATAKGIMAIARSFHIDAAIIGRVEESQDKQLTIVSPYGTFNYV